MQEQQNQNLELFIQKVLRYADLDKLTTYTAHDLIKAIYIGVPDKSNGKRLQSISRYFHRNQSTHSPFHCGAATISPLNPCSPQIAL